MHAPADRVRARGIDATYGSYLTRLARAEALVEEAKRVQGGTEFPKGYVEDLLRLAEEYLIEAEERFLEARPDLVDWFDAKREEVV